MSPSYQEKSDSQLPALSLLKKLGYMYISPEETVKQRGDLFGNVILENILKERLEALNGFEYKSKKYEFSDGNISNAVHALKNIQDEGLSRTNQKVYDLITLGKSFEENIEGDRKSFTLKYVDWENIQNNVFHVTDEFEVKGTKDTRRPDLVLFVNGIPFVVIENKRRDHTDSVKEAITQHIRNQRSDEGIPRLFHYTQLLLAVQPNEVKYAPIDTIERFWSKWKEEEMVDEVLGVVLSSTDNNTKSEDREITEQDRMLYSLCRRERLMDMTFLFTIFDGDIRKAARYQQYFTVKNTIERIKTKTNGVRKGGVVWHTQGSGKSLTMVMLAKVLSTLHNTDVKNPRVLIVTDRIELDRQIFGTFLNCGKTPVQAKTGAHLIELLSDPGASVITTVLHKFDSGVKRVGEEFLSSDIFVLIDESHRSQYGFSHQDMKQVLPNACYIGFTGTPLMHNEKNTVDKFGGLIRPTYTIDQAVKDGAVVPLLYEGRRALIEPFMGPMEAQFDMVTEDATPYEKEVLKSKFSGITEILISDGVVKLIANDIAKNYVTNWRSTGLKAMLTVPFRETAIKYLKQFENEVSPKYRINAAVIISAGDSRVAFSDVYKESEDIIKQWEENVKKRHVTLENYEKTVIDQFRSESEEVELLIVVGRLLTGFDAPRCGLLYIAKPLEGHNLLQAIARANRLHSGKDNGLIIDYVGLLENLDKALTNYSVLAGFDQDDLAGTLLNIESEVAKLSQYHGELHQHLSLANSKDNEALERFLAPEDLRKMFYEKLNTFCKTLQLARASDVYIKMYDEYKRNIFERDAIYYSALKNSLQIRYAEKYNINEYAKRIRKILDTTIAGTEVEILNEPVNIFDEKLFKEQVEKLTGTVASKADAIAYSMKRSISEKMDEDRAFYRKFSEMIDEAIKRFIEKRTSEIEYLSEVLELKTKFISGKGEDIPASLNSNSEARALFNNLKSELAKSKTYKWTPALNEKMSRWSLEIAGIIEKLVIRDWKKNDDIQKQMLNMIDDYLYDHLPEEKIVLEIAQLDQLLDELMVVARKQFKD